MRRRLRQVQPRERFTSVPDDPRVVANELLNAAWRQRWPQRPRWFDRLLHGDPPDAV